MSCMSAVGSNPAFQVAGSGPVHDQVLCKVDSGYHVQNTVSPLDHMSSESTKVAACMQ